VVWPRLVATIDHVLVTPRPPHGGHREGQDEHPQTTVRVLLKARDEGDGGLHDRVNDGGERLHAPIVGRGLNPPVDKSRDNSGKAWA
jgi:hypothetical protein